MKRTKLNKIVFWQNLYWDK